MLAKIHEQCFPSYWDINAFNDFFSIGGTHALVVTSSCGEPEARAQALCASQDDEPAGFVVYRISHEQADIMTIAVLPQYRRKGIAALLLEHVLAHIKRLGAENIFLDVEDGNHAAIALYEKHGFTHLKRRKLYYRQKDGTHKDALVMQKKL